MNIDIIEELKSELKTKFSEHDKLHDFNHALRVVENALIILESFDSNEIDKELVVVSCLIHDLYDHKLGYNESYRTEFTKALLSKYNFSTEFIEKSLYIVNNTSFSRNIKHHPFEEANIVEDADRLDAIGAIGIARAFAYGGMKNRDLYSFNPNDGNNTLAHFNEKLFKIKDLMKTKKGQELAEERDKFLRLYYNTLKNEIKF